ncbi:MAG: ABC transporter ATP-binding protein/permease [Proteobacteria bacterium]|nr:ABC transporter ATP-binding protein/permease [Pseudomonadota bacterium]
MKHTAYVPPGDATSSSGIMRRLWPRIRAEWPLMLGASSALGLSVAFRILDPWPIKFIFDRVLVRGADGMLQVALESDPGPWIAAVAGAVVAIAVLRAVTRYLSLLAMSVATGRVLAEVRGELYEHLQWLSPSTHERLGAGDLANRLTGDIEKLRLATTNTALQFTNNLVSMFGMLAVMFWIHWQLALVSSAFIPAFYLFGRRMTKAIRTTSNTHRETEGRLAAMAVEALSSVRAVQALALQESFASTFAAQSRLNLDLGTEEVRRSSMLQRGVIVLFALCLAAVLWRGSELVLSQAMTPGELLVFIAYLRDALEKPSTRLTLHVARFAQAAACARRIFGVLDQKPAVQQRPDAVAARGLGGRIEFRNVSYAYDGRGPVLSNISLCVEPRQRVALVGASGSGKSTLVSLLLRTADPNAGAVLVDGRDLRAYELTSYRKSVSVVLQEPMLFAASVRENILYGLPGASAEQVEAALRTADAWDFVRELPHGLDTILSERGASLSGGQRQRLAIARAAVRDAPIVVLDEPTVGLDRAGQAAVAGALRRLTQDRTALVVSHDLESTKDADQILLMRAGRIAERGTHAELMARNGHYARLFRSQVSVHPIHEARCARHA